MLAYSCSRAFAGLLTSNEEAMEGVDGPHLTLQICLVRISCRCAILSSIFLKKKNLPPDPPPLDPPFAGPQSAGPPRISFFFSPSPGTIFILFSSLGGLFVEIWWF